MPTISGTTNTTTTGEVIIISFDSAYLDVLSIDSYSDVIVGETSDKFFTKEFRWSDDSISFSAWGTLVGTGATSFNGIPGVAGTDIWLEYRYTRGGTGIGNLSVESITTNITLNNTETVQLPPVGTACGQPNFCAGVRIKCDKNLWNPYETASKAACLQEQLALGISDLFGHCVKYFKVDPQQRSRDVILREYSLYDVTDVKEIKIVVPDNEFPENAINFGPLDMDFEQDFEIHIVKEVFETVFGQVERPQERDYLYFPLTDRMYEINSAYLFKDFMQEGIYYKVSLRKWQDRKNVKRTDAVDTIVEGLTNDFEEILGVEREDEFLEVTKPLQYNVISTGGYDFIRSEMSTLLKIDNEDINNYWTIVAKYRYQLNTVTLGSLAVKYKKAVDIKATDNRAYTGWFNISKTAWGATGATSSKIINGTDGTSGISIDLAHTTGAGATGTTGINVTIGATSYSYGPFTALSTNKWYGLVVNLSNKYSEGSVYLWEMKYNPSLHENNPTTAQTTDLKLIFSETKSISIGAQKPANTYYELHGGEISLTNLRVFTEGIEEEKQPFILNQYVVIDSHKAKLVDNALPALRLSRNSRR